MAEGQQLTVLRIGGGVYRVESGGRGEIVYVAGSPENCWAFCKGQVFRHHIEDERSPVGKVPRHDVPQALTAPMPATVRSILVEPGAKVKKGDTLIILEAMKMELPLRALGDAVVSTIHCREGDLVQPETVLIELHV